MADSNCNLYPGLSAAEAKQARENLERYFELAFIIAEEAGAAKAGGVDTLAAGSTMEERSNAQLRI